MWLRKAVNASLYALALVSRCSLIHTENERSVTTPMLPQHWMRLALNPCISQWALATQHPSASAMRQRRRIQASFSADRCHGDSPAVRSPWSPCRSLPAPCTAASLEKDAKFKDAQNAGAARANHKPATGLKATNGTLRPVSHLMRCVPVHFKRGLVNSALAQASNTFCVV